MYNQQAETDALYPDEPTAAEYWDAHERAKDVEARRKRFNAAVAELNAAAQACEDAGDEDAPYGYDWCNVCEVCADLGAS